MTIDKNKLGSGLTITTKYHSKNGSVGSNHGSVYVNSQNSCRTSANNKSQASNGTYASNNSKPYIKVSNNISTIKTSKKSK